MISIVIPTYNQKARLAITIDALSEQTALNCMSVFVVNDGSTDGTYEFLNTLNYDWLTVIHQENMGRSVARNNGINHIHSKYVLFLDDDIVVNKNFIEEHLYLQKKQAGIYIGEIYNIPAKNHRCFVTAFNKTDSIQDLRSHEQEDVLVNLGRYFCKSNQKNTSVSWVCMVAANVSLPLRMFKEVNGFDPQFKGWGIEDHELAFRFHQAGAEFYFLKEAAAFHLDHHKKINRTLLLENILYFYKKHSPDIEVKAYVDYITSKIPMSSLYEQVMNCKAVPEMRHRFFSPNSHLLNKGDV